jgi:5-methylcytosine-specific restriction endonuclease McrA
MSASPSLRSLSDDVLLSRLRDLVGREREVTLAVLDHLNEIRRRELHLRLGHPSLFAYCTRALGYSSSAAGRRIQAAVCLARFPEVRDLLASGEANVCTIAMVSLVLTPANGAELLARIRGMSQRDVQALVAEHDSFARTPRDRITAITVAAPARNALSLLAPEIPVHAMGATNTPASDAHTACETQNYSRSGSELSPAARPASQAGAGGAASATESDGLVCMAGPGCAENHCTIAATDTPEARFRVQFSAGPAFMAQLERVRVLASHRLPANAPLEQVFALALEYFIEREDPAKRHERRERRAEKHRDEQSRTENQSAEQSHAEEQGAEKQLAAKQGAGRQGTATQDTTVARQLPDPQSQRPPRRRQPIPAGVRDAVFVRDTGRCAVVGPDGLRCGSTRVLQVDHIRPVALGGENDAGNLRLLCAHHNRFEAERLLGAFGGMPDRLREMT